GILPFHVKMLPSNPEFIDYKHLKMGPEKLNEHLKYALTQDAGREILEKWLDQKLSPPYNSSGFNRCKVILLGYNLAEQIPFFKKWMGEDLYNEWFNPFTRDILNTATYLNDRAATHASDVPYSKTDFTYLCSVNNLERRERKFDS